MKDHSVSVDQAIYATSVVYNTITNFYKTNFPSDMIFAKADAYTSNEQVEKLTREFNIHYRACIGSLIYLLYTRLYLSFSVHKLSKVSSSSGKVNFGGLVNLLR